MDTEFLLFGGLVELQIRHSRHLFDDKPILGPPSQLPNLTSPLRLTKADNHYDHLYGSKYKVRAELCFSNKFPKLAS